MGRKPAVSLCLFCNSMPCQCRAQAAAAAKASKPAEAAKPDVLPSAPKAARAKFDAQDAMRASAGTVAPSPTPAPVAPVSAPLTVSPTAPGPLVPTMAPRRVKAVTAQAQRDSDLLAAAVHLVKVALGGQHPGAHTGKDPLQVSAAQVRLKMKGGAK